ncbi:exopolyphosphatase [Spiribacter sp. 218]|uniref:exopolyphosphatase n=1 Tax=Spiribacter pallidus TaxID=1987936 RepID=UPI00349F5B1D
MKRRRRPTDDAEVAAVDLGSNSFHMIVARPEGNSLRMMDRLREPVRLAAGLDDKRRLDAAARDRALACLERFGQRLRGLPSQAVRAVGTNTLRQLRAADDFLDRAQAALGHPIQIVSGYEEARLVYLGVAHSIAGDDRRRLVMDIGGGSTELIIGEAFVPRQMESLHMGCVSATQRFFADGRITEKTLQAAELAARRELEPIAARYRRAGWERAVGASGTIRSVERCLRDNGWSENGIHPAGLARLRAALIKAGRINKLTLDGVSARRAEVLPGGFAVLSAAFDQLGIAHMDAADGALREGLLFDLLGRIRHEDVRSASIAAMARRYHVDTEHAGRVADTAEQLRRMVADAWQLDEPGMGDMLRWAASVHEIGLDISHSQYHKHGEYILRHSDLAGFSREDQQVIATLVRAHRRKFPRAVFRELPQYWQRPAMRLAIVLRLATTLHRARTAEPPPPVSATTEGKTLHLALADRGGAGHALIEADLQEEADYIAVAGYRLLTSRG